MGFDTEVAPIEGPAPRFFHRLFFWFFLATIAMVLPEVVTLNDPIPWASAMGWQLGYPIYGLHILALAGLMYRRPIGGFAVLLAYGGLFGLYEGYMIKQLWNPNWGTEQAWGTIGGVQPLHTVMLVFWLHPLMAYILPLLLTERLMVRPGKLSHRFPSIFQSKRGTRILLFGTAVYCALSIGSKLSSPSEMEIPLTSIAVLSALGLIWRLPLRGGRFRLEELLPQGRSLAVIWVLLFLSYLFYGSTLRREAMPTELVSHIVIWLIYLFLISIIITVTRRTSPLPSERPPLEGWSNAKAVMMAGVTFIVLLLVILIHLPSTLPGAVLILVSFVLGGIFNILFLLYTLLKSLVSSNPVSEEKKNESLSES